MAMSYCRWTPDSDVYVYGSEIGYVCHDCTLPGCEFIIEATGAAVLALPSEMIEHLLLHRETGDKVPQYAIDGLTAEIIDDPQTRNLATLE
jgi:hypothetical protein